jgi:endonuclease/exonuclease/phosphatase family metal-dependent hydrolase
VLPIIIGGDFNLIRSESDKSNGVGDRHLMNAFNCFIEECELREMHRGARFAWTNNQEVPIQSNIDRVLFSDEWEFRYPTCTLISLTRIGSDHSPMLLNSGKTKIVKSRQFFFENQWTQTEGFREMIQEKWGGLQA